MHRRIFLFGLILLLLLTTGCAGKRLDPEDHSRSIVYGYIDMKEAPVDLEWARLGIYGGDDDGSWYTAGATDDGVFFHLGLPAGSYQLDRFGGEGGIPYLNPIPYVYNFDSQGKNQTAVKLTKPVAHYMGAYKFKDVKVGIFEAAKFDMEKITTPSEKEVIQKLLAYMEKEDLMKYTHQIDLLRKRLAQL